MAFLFQAGEYPASPGCYIMKDAGGRILYVGKSKNLRSRLRSYFQSTPDRRRVRQQVSEIAAIEVVLVNNEAESLLLENNLIKLHKPPYNRALKKDNSGFAYLQLTNERFPRLAVYYRNRSRQVPSDPLDGKRLGPYPSARFRDELMEFITEHFGLRTCSTLPKQVCLLYHIGKCSGVCAGMITEDQYRETAQQAAELLASSGQGLIEAMYAKMELYASRLEFEKAQHMLKHIRILEQAPDKQIVDRESAIDQDVLYFGEAHVLIAKVQEGMLTDFQLHELEQAYSEIACDRFIVSRYGEARPAELIVNRIGDTKRVRSALRVKGKGAVKLKITQPLRGLKYDLLQLCKDNYEYRLRRL
ncbi:GIY-YIG nuclease family protein [Paenibacillus cremeus]|uniref:Nucleotide excision repair endonuclease n=1 Tax=Paenibacillus cremeus TaxID=2163881 RepID=A0A559KDT2_9BACL|nr:GIY-YIG nuclease family protein [Paenibacillus cremeus]TVY10269.1 nucleotide excision repair endonuclease [Paenibacillus cremeus]